MAKPILSLLAHLHARLRLPPGGEPGGRNVLLTTWCVRRPARRLGGRGGGVPPRVGRACRSTDPATVYVPPGVYLVSTATFSGPCHGHVAVHVRHRRHPRRPLRPRWPWLVQGGGSPSRTGWASSSPVAPSTAVAGSLGPVDFAGATVRPQPRSSHVAVYDARISTGDDCVSIGPGNSHLWIERVACGPGHGISIGSLGKQEGMAVGGGGERDGEDDVVHRHDQRAADQDVGGTKRGFRQGRQPSPTPPWSPVDNPIIIDQRYCPGGGAKLRREERGELQHQDSDVRYVGIRGNGRRRRWPSPSTAAEQTHAVASTCRTWPSRTTMAAPPQPGPRAGTRRGARSGSCCLRAASDPVACIATCI
ncbi:hypothetical protein HU200_011338 [Digitaria exilis]|uniref:Uncharacterized protein n=1 Tax=Digitaria exilis TaxID=1010633 RepID=A0A835FHB5_9POAL|nr:hypothetical protein HU200_011338 [Digitaria exilis]